MDVISGLHENLFIMMRALQNGFKVTSEGETLILSENCVDVCFKKEMTNHNRKRIIFSTNLYKSANYTAHLSSKKCNLEGNTAIQLQGEAVKNQEQTTTKQQTPQKNHINDIHANLDHPKEDSMHAITNRLHYIVNGEL